MRSAAMLTLLVCALPHPVKAASVLWNTNLPNYAVTQGGKCVPAMLNGNLTVSYASDVVDAETGVSLCGQTIPVNRKVIFKPKALTSDDIYWFGTGYYFDSPYGDAVPGALPPPVSTMCSPKNLFAAGFQVTAASFFDYYGTISVNPPAVSYSRREAFECSSARADGSIACTAHTPGFADTLATFAATYAKPYEQSFYVNSCVPTEWNALSAYESAINPYDGTGWHYCSGLSDSTIAIPAQGVSCPITITPVVGAAPQAPNVNAIAGVSCTAGAQYTLVFNATDADQDALRYLVDWNGDGQVDQIVPQNGYLPSGTPASTSRSFATSGQKSVRVLAQDKSGLMSLWTPFAFSCAGLSATAVFGDEGDATDDSAGGSGNTGGASASPDLTLRAVPSLVHANDTVKVSWSATHVSSCTVDGTNGDVWDTIQSAPGGNVSSPIRQSTTYLLRCLDTHGTTLAKSVTVNILPNWQEQ